MFKAILGTLSTLVFIAWAVARIWCGINFDINIENYISQAASSPNPQIAIEKLDVAIAAARQQGLIAGNTGIFFTYPTNDIGFWYQRLVDSRKILASLGQNDAPLEVSNTMMRVHESLTAAGDKGSEYTIAPHGISIYPHNVAFFWWALASFFAAVGFFLAAVIDTDW